MEKDRLFESHVDIIKYKVLRELARQTWAGRDAFMAFNDIANVVVKKGEPPSRCCIYKDRAVIAERIRIGLGEYHGSKDTVQVVSIACDECPKSGHVVTSLCRGCLAHYCRSVCPKGAIAIDTKGYAHIDKERCIECGRCASACKYHAITNMIRPCERSCPVDAISMSEDGSASIDQDQCIVCGTCITECPFGALNDISAVVRVIHAIQAKGIRIARVTLHVGLGTFRPVKVDDVEQHHMHSEFYMVEEDQAKLINETKKNGGRIIAVGTTSCRTLESATGEDGILKAGSGWTEIFIYPGYQFKLIDCLITNFHLPESTLMMLVSALAGRDKIMAAYEEAVKERYRFFSFGDAMFIKKDK